MTLTISKTTNGHGEAAVTDGAVQADLAPSVVPNPPAFPVMPGVPANGRIGMTLRDWFAGQALAGLLARGPAKAELAYTYADAMLKARGAQ